MGISRVGGQCGCGVEGRPRHGGGPAPPAGAEPARAEPAGPPGPEATAGAEPRARAEAARPVAAEPPPAPAVPLVRPVRAATGPLVAALALELVMCVVVSHNANDISLPLSCEPPPAPTTRRHPAEPRRDGNSRLRRAPVRQPSVAISATGP